MNKNRVRMKLVLEKQEFTEKMNTRNISSNDADLLGSLMLNAYRDTIDYNGESLDITVKD